LGTSFSVAGRRLSLFISRQIDAHTPANARLSHDQFRAEGEIRLLFRVSALIGAEDSLSFDLLELLRSGKLMGAGGRVNK
jgi:hypothetical protein